MDDLSGDDRGDSVQQQHDGRYDPDLRSSSHDYSECFDNQPAPRSLVQKTRRQLDEIGFPGMERDCKTHIEHDHDDGGGGSSADQPWDPDVARPPDLHLHGPPVRRQLAELAVDSLDLLRDLRGYHLQLGAVCRAVASLVPKKEAELVD